MARLLLSYREPSYQASASYILTDSYAKITQAQAGKSFT